MAGADLFADLVPGSPEWAQAAALVEAERLAGALGARYGAPAWATDLLAVAEWLQLHGRDSDPDYLALLEALRAVYC